MRLRKRLDASRDRQNLPGPEPPAAIFAHDLAAIFEPFQPPTQAFGWRIKHWHVGQGHRSAGAKKFTQNPNPHRGDIEIEKRPKSEGKRKVSCHAKQPGVDKSIRRAGRLGASPAR